MIRGVLLLTAIFAAAPSAAEVLVGRASVLDGDTIEIRGQRVRLAAIDAPEGRQQCKDEVGRDYPCGRRAAFALADLLAEGRQVSCKVASKDRFDRLIAECFVGDQNVNAWMVASGWAIAYRRYGGERYARHEDDARVNRRGMWRGDFIEPAQFRRSGQ